ncbi:MAG: hypothetical protein A2014_12905 [Spirochaetes bacterium GWF1_49_6]|jgi:hypothetical protein|nr:MAG: hypothetical protein A2014_12905 [Spirochaetes bacterium GWF1_49_6]
MPKGKSKEKMGFVEELKEEFKKEFNKETDAGVNCKGDFKFEVNMDAKDKKAGSLMFGIILIVAGGCFLLGHFFPFFRIGNLWPLFIMFPVPFISIALFTHGKKAAGVLIPITILTFLTVYFLWLNVVGWALSAQTWPNYILAPGLGFLFAGLYGGEPGFYIPAGILIALALIFYFAFFNFGIMIAILLIAMGLLVIAKTVFQLVHKKS